MYIKSKLFSFKFMNMYYSTLDPLQRKGTLLVGGIDIDVPVHCNGSKVYLFSGVHPKHIIYLFFSNLP